MFSKRQPTSQIQTKALSKFYTTMNGPLWRRSSNWLVGDPCLVRKIYILKKQNYFLLKKEPLVWS